MKKEETKSKTFTMRLSDAQDSYLEAAINRVEDEKGVPTSKAFIVLKMMEFGREGFERWLNSRSKKSA